MTKKKFTKRRAARFFITQALYQIEHSDQPLPLLIGQFVRTHFENSDHELAGDADEDLFRRILEGVTHHQSEIDQTIGRILLDGWTVDRLDAVVRALLRASTFESMYDLETPLPVIINEYVEIAKVFVAQGEVTFIHVAMDKIGHLVREAKENKN